MDNKAASSRTYAVVKGILIKKTTVEVQIYPEIEEQVRRMIIELEEVYELRGGLEKKIVFLL